MMELTPAEILKADVLNALLEDDEENAKFILSVITIELLNKVYKASKQLSDLCWQEIQRRRRGE
jgi:hypothetical protein